ncbi:long-chain-fatty-acid--CoA ligase [Dactylosporangium sp. McL0621]|uniref:long-chain-fatty-acid--CoA ligase n=1 Tax=Dactylosporangium sp. McL0621 TaxID=3415678 RepID=UPI003CEECA4D
MRPFFAVHADGGRVTSVADIIRRRAAATPALTAVIEAGRTTTFGALDERSNRVAQALIAAGVAPGDRVAYIGANAPEFLEVLYGATKAGAIATAVNNRLARPEIAAILSDAAPAALIVDDPSLVPPGARAVCTGDEYEAWLSTVDPVDPLVPAGPDDTAVIFYTSGTTGRPKGIMLSGDNLGQALATMHYDMELTTTSVAMAPIPYFHISGLGLALVANLNGAALLLETAAGPDALIALLARRRVSHAAVVPTILQTLLQLPGTRETDWSALRYLVYGAMPIPLPVIRAATEVFGCKFLQSYGLTESTGGVTVLWPEDHLPDEPRKERRLRSVGRPMPGVSLRVVDPVTLSDLPPGERGEVLIGGGHVMRGYWRNPAATSATIVDGWVRTGDGGSFDEDGYLYLHDRIKDMIVSGGENVYPAEVESVLTGHPDLAEVAVVGVPSARWGESPVAVVVPRAGHTPDEAEVIAWCRERLAHFKCPVAVHVVETLPRNASGKLLKHALRSSFS